MSKLNFVEILRKRAADQAERRALTFLSDGEREEVHLTYGDLDRQARAIAASLGERKGERALLIYPPGLEYVAAFFGCLYAGVIAVPVYPPEPARLDRTLPRLQAIAKDAQAKIALTTQPILAMAQTLSEQAPDLKALEWLATDAEEAGREDLWKPPALNSGDVAFLQYTSGSTGSPKGVMVSHGNLLHNSEAIHRLAEHSPESVYVSWLPAYHDMGLIGGVLQPVYGGFPGVLMPPYAFLQRPLRWLQAISRYRGTTSPFPNFALDLCVRKVSPEQRDALDLSRWRLACNGAEPIRPESLEAFSDFFGPCGFRKESHYPAYGLAEATLIASGGARADLPVVKTLDARTLVGCGRPLSDQKTVIVDPENRTQRLPGQVGEIWISGPSVAKGYWNKPRETEENFRAYLSGMKEGPFLRTGDLGFVEDGELFVTGRLKDLIIIRGQNHFPQDIELTVEKCDPRLRPGCGAAFSAEIGGEERLVIVHEAEGDAVSGLEALIHKIRRAVAEKHDLKAHAVVLIPPRTIPKTSSGKIQRHACKTAFLKGTLKPARSEEIRDWLLRELARRLSIKPGDIDPRQPFASYGLDSREAVELTGELEVRLGRPLSPTLAWHYPTVETLAAHLSGEASGPSFQKPQDSPPASSKDPIAVVGMGCRFPGARTPDEFWRLLRKGVDAVREVPKNRWNADDFYDPVPATPGKMNTRWGGFLEEVDRFDASFFNIAPREAARMDPQQRLLLETSWEALENAGINPEKLAGRAAGVFIGVSGSDYARLHAGNLALRNAYDGTGNAPSVAANRISYVLDLRGPSEAIDTACSSSLVAVHRACRSLEAGECELALVGGVNLLLSPEPTIVFSQARMMASDGRCKTFDASADGYVRGEGCGVIVLKRLSDAVKDGDPILAVIRGSAVNQDGKSNGLTAPNGLAQQEVVRRALENAGVSPNEITYIEAHGTGTPLGDPIEIQSLASVLGERGPDAPSCWIGSVKTNIGHLEAAAGIAGLIKTVLALRSGEIPPHLHFKKWNPRITLDGSPLVLPTKAIPWRSGNGRRRAGVSSFGFGGTNAHVILEEGPSSPEPAERTAGSPPQLLALSAKSEEALRNLCERYVERLKTDRRSPESISDLCFNARTGRASFDHRLAVLARSIPDLRSKLKKFLGGVRDSQIVHGLVSLGKRPDIVFLFTGQGSQYAGMGRGLYETEPVFRKTLETCQEILGPHLERPLLLDLYPAPGETSRLDETALTQPALFALEYSLAQLWLSWGIRPQAVLGHSVGEYVAACIAGIFSLEDGLKLVAERGRLMQALPKDGAMAAVAAPAAGVAARLASYAGQLSLAADNGPNLAVISGRKEAVDDVLEKFRGDGIGSQRLSVSHAFHSPLMEPMLPAFASVLKTVRLSAPRLPLVSNATGTFLTEDQIRPEYWLDHIRRPVQFGPSMAFLEKVGHRVFLEIGPKPTLCGLARQILTDEEKHLLLPSLSPAEGPYSSLARLYVRGFPIDGDGFSDGGKRRKIVLPNYPFERKRFWIDSETERPDDWFYEIRWRPRKAPQRRVSQDIGTWLILADRGGVGRRLATLLKKRGGRPILVSPGRFPKKLSCDGIVYLGSLDAPSHPRITASQLENATLLHCGNVLSLVRELSRDRGSVPPRLWLVTRGAQTADGDKTPSLIQTPLWGLGRSLAMENPKIWGGLLDLPPVVEKGEAEWLLDEILDPEGEDRAALRKGKRHVARLTPVKCLRPRAFRWRADGAYLITGGRGALGLQVARWMAAQGVRHIVLMGRTKRTAHSPSIGDIEAAGARVYEVFADVSRKDSLSLALKGLRKRGLPPLRGVVHAAGSLALRPLAQMKTRELRNMLRPKVTGTWLLHRLLKNDPLDFFVSFSSSSSLLSSPRLGHYAAANAFLDAMTHYRRALGLPALSLNWGPWGRVGMAAGRSEKKMNAVGLRVIPPEKGLMALDRLLRSAATQVAILPNEWRSFLENFTDERGLPFFSELQSDPTGAPEGTEKESRLKEKILAAPESDRRKIVESYLCSQVALALGLKRPEVDARARIDAMGLDSLMAVELKNKVERGLGVALSVSKILQGSCIADLAGEVLSAWRRPPPVSQKAVDPQPSPREFPLSVNQRAMWFIHQLEPKTSSYNIVRAMRLTGDVDAAGLRSAFQKIVDRHSSLRSFFSARDGEPVQAIRETMSVRFREMDASSWTEETLNARLVEEGYRPFDLEKDPLLRVSLFTRSRREGVLLVSLHHIVSDFWSLAVLMGEAGAFYEAQKKGMQPPLEPLTRHYGDHARWESAMLEGPEGASHWDYWKKRLAGNLPSTTLPTDRPRPAVQTYSSAIGALDLPAGLTRSLAAYGKDQGATLFMTLLAAYKTLLYRLTGQEDLIVGTLMAARNSPDLAPQIGLYANLAALRTDLSGRPAFREILRRVRRTVLEAFEHQDYPFALVVGQLQPERDPSRSPIFQTVFNFLKTPLSGDRNFGAFALGEPGRTLRLGNGSTLRPYPLRHQTVNVDLSLVLAESDGGIRVNANYNKDLFHDKMIASMLTDYRKILEEIAR